MQELVRRLARAHHAKAADPAIAASRRRRALVEEDDQRRNELQLHERLWLELNPMAASTRAARDEARRLDRERLERIAKGGGYVGARDDGVLVQPVRDSGEPEPDEHWWAQRHLQHALTDLRRRQQELMAQALRASRLNPARVAADSPIVWGPAVDLLDRARLRRWATAPTFRADLVSIARRLAEADSHPATAAPAPHPSRSSAPSQRLADGFGVSSTSPPPAFTPPDLASVRVRAIGPTPPPPDLSRGPSR